MPEIHKIEQEIGWYKVMFVVLSTIDVSLFAWFVQNYEVGKPLVLATCFVGIIALTLFIFVINWKVFVLLQRLGYL